ncbi:MAG: aspartate/glutamate racemase family protein [Pseudochelatococcus sp.]|jgi:allantoin racemase|uniref:aspartate/glutamate racemase family protein n=1 Tax=Pseudochelatococcus sp. TaxID=2020869 RepID=UPI003D8CF6D2
MRIFWQSFVDASASAPYMARLQEYLNGIAAPGAVVDVAGISPPDRDFGRLSELRCAILAIDNGLAAEEAGYDAVVIGHFQDPGLYELRASLRIPVVGAGEASLHAGAQLGRRLGLVTLDGVFETWHLEQAALYGLEGRIAGVRGLDCMPGDFSDALAGDETAYARMREAFVACARPLVDAGADVVIPAGILPGLLISREHGFTVGRAPVLNSAAVALKSAEMWVQLHRLNGIEPSRGPGFARTPERAKADFRALVAHGRAGPRPV